MLVVQLGLRRVTTEIKGVCISYSFLVVVVGVVVDKNIILCNNNLSVFENLKKLK